LNGGRYVVDEDLLAPWAGEGDVEDAGGVERNWGRGDREARH
jgi:hypothetical protein